MADPPDVRDALDRLAAEVSRLRQIVDAEHPDFFLAEEWQQDPPQPLPPWFGQEPLVIRSQATFDISTT